MKTALRRVVLGATLMFAVASTAGAARFEAFFPAFLKTEGGFVNDPADPGGIINKGITLATFKLVAQDYLGIAPTLDNLKALGDEQAAVIYKRMFWDPLRGDDIASQQVADIAFDFAVNAGSVNAGKLLQRVLNDLGTQLPVNGAITPVVISALNGADAKAVFARYRQGRIDYYQDLVAKHPALGKFLRGWMIRVESFPSP